MPLVLDRLRDVAARLLGLALVGALVAGAMASGVLTPLEDGLAALRFRALQREPSHQVTVVEIDVASLQAAGRWPWSRDRYAKAIENLEAAGAEVVAFDVDFSARSADDADESLAAAIKAHAGAVVLPSFVQPASTSGDGGRLIESAPLADLASDALIASVNVPMDRDGRVRRYNYGFGGGERYRPSMAALLAHSPGQRTDTFVLDYSTRIHRFDRISFQDALTGRFDPGVARGRKVLIGATALELGDEFATVHSGPVNGVYIHALALENLMSGRALRELRPEVVFGLAMLLAVFLRPTRRGAILNSLVRRHLLALGALAAVPVLLQAALPLSATVAPLMLTQGLCFAWAVREELVRRARLIAQEREARLMHLAMHDPETGLPNRRALVQDLNRPLAGGPAAMAMVAVGIDRFATMRGAVGYAMASRIVLAVAQRLMQASHGGMVAHLSTSVLGFAVRGENLDQIRREIAGLEAVDPGVEVDGHPVDAFLRFGVSYQESEEEDVETLLEQATLALDEARRSGRRLLAFDQDALPDPLANLAMMSDMRRGLSAGELSLHYQPKLAPAQGSILGCEALVRWRHPVHGFIRPDLFVGVAEETGAIRELTEWTLRQALADLDRFEAMGAGLMVSVNISGRLLADPGFRGTVLDLVGARADRLCLEITETAVIDNPAAAEAAVRAFHEAGLKVSIDDYGVGLSSLSYLKMLHADELKMDRSLVKALTESPRDRLIVKSTIDLAHSLGMSVVAEGVEGRATFEALCELGCDFIQGYLVGKPMPVDDFEAFLASNPLSGAEPQRRRAVG